MSQSMHMAMSEHDKPSSHPNVMQVLIAVLQSMKSNPPQGSSAEIARAFASILFKSWQYNDVNCLNGALIFFSAAEQQVWHLN